MPIIGLIVHRDNRFNLMGIQMGYGVVISPIGITPAVTKQNVLGVSHGRLSRRHRLYARVRCCSDCTALF